MAETKKWEPCSGGCRGWILSNSGNEIQRCDEDGRFETDLEAFAFALTDDLAHLREQVQARIATRTLEVLVTERITAMYSVECCVSYVGDVPVVLGSAPKDVAHFLVQPLDGDSKGYAVMADDGEIHLTGWPSKKESTT